MSKKIFFIVLMFFALSLVRLVQGDSPKLDHPAMQKPEEMSMEEMLQELQGNWAGRGAGEEVRYRHPKGLLILTVKHTTEFIFHINEKGEVAGEGTIEYDLIKNTSGLDDLVAQVHGMLGLLPSAVPAAPTGSVAPKTSSELTKHGVKGLSKIQYDAPHLKHGKELRHFKFTGRVQDGRVQKQDKYMEYAGNEPRTNEKLIYLEEVKNFTLPDSTPSSTLIAAWEVNNVKEEKPFPCWSPFLNEPGILRRGPGGIWLVEFQEKGTQRNGVRVWQEYGYVWAARKEN